MNTPDFMPTLSVGSHAPNSGSACVMEYVSLLAGEEWTDSPACTHPVLARMAQVVNDRLSDSERHHLVPLIGRLFGTAETGTEAERRVLSVRLAVWCGRQVLHHASDCAAAEHALATAEAWCAGDASAAECRVAADAAAYAANNAAADAADAAAYATNAAAYAANNAAADAADAAANNAAAAAAYAAAYATNAADAYVALLTGLLDEYDRLTGRATHRVLTDTDLRDLAAAI